MSGPLARTVSALRERLSFDTQRPSLSAVEDPHTPHILSDEGFSANDAESEMSCGDRTQSLQSASAWYGWGSLPNPNSTVLPVVGHATRSLSLNGEAPHTADGRPPSRSMDLTALRSTTSDLSHVPRRQQGDRQEAPYPGQRHFLADSFNEDAFSRPISIPHRARTFNGTASESMSMKSEQVPHRDTDSGSAFEYSPRMPATASEYGKEAMSDDFKRYEQWNDVVNFCSGWT